MKRITAIVVHAKHTRRPRSGVHSFSMLWLALALLLRVDPPAMDAHALYAACHLRGSLNEDVFVQAIQRAEAIGSVPSILAIADMHLPASEKRFVVVDLQRHRVLVHSWVAHGKGSGEERCERVSNVPGSYATSAGCFRIGERIISPRHGAAIMLYGLESGVNDKAEEREIILHGADYVSADFIKEHGRLGRSWGCPAVSPEVMTRLITLLPEGSLLFVSEP